MFKICDSAEAVVFQLEEEVRVVKRLRDLAKAHWFDTREQFQFYQALASPTSQD